MREKPSRINPVSWPGGWAALGGEWRAEKQARHRDAALLGRALDHCPHHNTALLCLLGHVLQLYALYGVICVPTLSN